MRKRKGEVKRMVIELDMGDPEQARLWGYWTMLANAGVASNWARSTLAEVVPGQPQPIVKSLKDDDQMVAQVQLPPQEPPRATPPRHPAWNQQPHAVPKPGAAKPKGEVRRVPVDDE